MILGMAVAMIELSNAIKNTLKHKASVINPSLTPVGYSVPSSRVWVCRIDVPACDVAVGDRANADGFSFSTWAPSTTGATSGASSSPSDVAPRSDLRASGSFSKSDMLAALGTMVGARDSSTADESTFGSSILTESGFLEEP